MSGGSRSSFQRGALTLTIGLVSVLAIAQSAPPSDAPPAEAAPAASPAVKRFAQPLNQLSPADLDAWTRVLRSIVRLEDRSGTIAILIDAKGLFLSADTPLAVPKVRAVTADGRVLTLQFLTSDDASQLTLWQSEPGEVGDLLPVVIADRASVTGEVVYAATSDGPTKGHFVAWGRVGVMRPSLRYVPLSEIRFEAVPKPLGGAPVFLSGGRLAGLVSATLEPVTITPRGEPSPATFGPVGLTVGYALGTTVLDRVVTGFRSPSRRPEHPTIGAFFRDGSEPGARVVEVMEGSPAAKAGLREDDLIIQLDQAIVSDAVDLAALLFDQRVGRVVRLTVRRKGEADPITLAVTVGRREEASGARKVPQTPP